MGAQQCLTRFRLENILESAQLVKCRKLGTGDWTNHLRASVVFSGCDFFAKLFLLNIGKATEGYIAASDKASHRHTLEATNLLSPNVVAPDTTTVGAPGFAELAEKVVSHLSTRQLGV